MAQAFDMHSLEFRLPDLGEGLTEAEIVHWLVEVGDFVTVDQPVVEVETAKAMVEVPCPYGGVVTARFGEEGMELPVGAPLLTVAVGAEKTQGASTPLDGDDPEGATPQGDAPTTESGPVGRPRVDGEPAPSKGTVGGSGNVLVGYGTADAPARRPRVRPAPLGGPGPLETEDARTPPVAGRDARSTDPDAPGGQEPGPPAPSVRARRGGDGLGHAGGQAGQRLTGADEDDENALSHGPVPVISPLVRKLARDHGLDLRELAGSGPDGLILRADVEYAVRASSSRAASAAPAREAAAPTRRGDQAPPTGHVARSVPERSATAGPGATEGAQAVPGAAVAPGARIALRGLRGTAAERLTRSRREIPDATCWVDADATELMNARTAMNAVAGPKISVLALLARICTAALARFPELNSTVDVEAREIVTFDAVHIGFAAQTERGLVVPVVRDAHARDAESLSAEFARLTEAARSGTLAPAELTGGTFTVNNYGVFGVDGSTPIINHPEAAMLGVGRITPKPWVHQGELAVRQVVQLSLTFDHRVCDGGTAGGFLRFVADCVEHPAILLRTL